MSHLLSHIDRVVDNLNNPEECSFRKLFENKQIKIQIIEFKENKKLFKQHLNKLATEEKSTKAFKRQIQYYQTSLTKLLDLLYTNHHECIYFSECRKKILRPKVNFYISYLELLQQSFPDYFNTAQPVPFFLYLNIRKKLYKLFSEKNIASIQYKTVSDLCILIKSVFDENTIGFSFQAINYWNDFICGFPTEIIKDVTYQKEEKIQKKLLFRYLISVNFNNASIYQFITDDIKHVATEIDDQSKRIHYLSRIKKNISQIAELNSRGFYPYGETLKQMLLNCIKKEINYYKYSYTIIQERSVSEVDKIQSRSVNKFKTNFSVGQMGYFLRTLVDNKIMEIDKDHVGEFIKLFSNNFSSLRSVNVSTKHLSNKYYDPEEYAVKSIKELFLRLYRSSNN